MHASYLRSAVTAVTFVSSKIETARSKQNKKGIFFTWDKNGPFDYVLMWSFTSELEAFVAALGLMLEGFV